MSVQETLERRSGWIAFAAIVMLAIGTLRVISGIFYLADSVRINNLTNGMFSNDLWVWGLIDLGIAAIALYAAYSLLAGGEFGRVVGYLWAVLVIVHGFLIIEHAPWYAAGAIILATLVIYGLASTPRTST